MNSTSIYTLKALQKIYAKTFHLPPLSIPSSLQDPDEVSRVLYEKLSDEHPCMIARFGAFELSTLMNYLGVKYGTRNVFQYIQGKSLDWWWSEKLLLAMQTNAGFFPPTMEKIEQFCELMLGDLKEVDVLGSWLAGETYFENEMHCIKVHLRLLEPYWAAEPWTSALKNKKVLVIHPFASTIVHQYEKRELLFKVKDTLPAFKSLTVIQAVQTIGEASDEFSNWFEALDSMKKQIDKADFDICLIGAGAYGFPLAAYVKRIGKKAVHLGGALQLLFGIKGKRWEDPNYGVKEWGIPYGFYPALMNEHWTRPLNIEKPKTANAVEGACYW